MYYCKTVNSRWWRSILLLIPFFFTASSRAQVNSITGGVELSVPLYSYSDGDKLALNVNVTYTAGNGVKVNDMASEVGLGWKINAGGSISRMTMGKPDDQYGNLGINKTGTGRMYAPYTSLLTDCYSDVGTLKREYNGWDREADVFFFSFNGRSGSFVIGRKKSGDTEYPVTVIGDSKLKVRLFEADMSSSNVITRITRFEIITEDGTQYTFSNKELSEIFTTDRDEAVSPPPISGPIKVIHPGDPIPTSDEVTVTPYHTGKYVVNNWYLTQVKNVRTQKAINYVYDSYSVDYSFLGLPIKTATLNAANEVDNINYTIFNQQFAGVKMRLATIYAGGYATLTFTYDNTRQDLVGEPVLTALKVTARDENAVIANYNFNYRYHNVGSFMNYADAPAATATAKANLRLSLMSIENVISGSPKPYMSFDYKPGIVPGRGSMWQDMYGYFIGVFAYGRRLDDFFNDQYRLPAATNPLSTQVRMAAQMGMLDKVNYAAGGYLQYDYENNSYFNNGTEQYYGGVRVASATLYDGIDHANDQVVTYKYRNADGSSSGTGYETGTYTKDNSSYYVSNGTHMASKIISYAVNTAVSIYSGNPTLSSGIQASELTKLIDDIISFFIGNKAETATYNTRSWAAYPLFTTNPLPFFYSRVEVIHGTEAANKGKIVYQYTDFGDKEPYTTKLNPPYSAAQRVQSWAIGNPRNVTTYSASGKVIKDVFNEYKVISTSLSDSIMVSCKCDEYNSVSPWTLQNSLRSKINFYSETYYPVTGRAELVRETERFFDLNGNITTNITDYEYDLNYYNLKKITTTNSKNEVIEERIYYPYNYSANSVLTSMTSNNEINTTVATETWLVNGTDRKIVNGVFSNFVVQTNGAVLPSSSYQFFSNKPVAEGTIGVFNGVLNRAPAYFKEDVKYAYDIFGNVSQVETKGEINSYIHDYWRQMLALTTNAAYSETAYAGFEEAENGTWAYSFSGIAADESNGTIQTPKPMTGTFYYKLANGNITKSATGLVAGKKYKISYWVTTGAIATNPQPVTLNYTNTFIKLNKYNNYTYFEHEFTMGTSDIVLSGSVTLDNLRLYPSDAVMQTYDYDKKGNIISSIDENNKILIYQYDNQNRPISLFDQYSNMLKHYEYNY
ncbi:RHS repeat domain-containing protein [Chitinophaga pinensis]|uniref:YD repeat protein n=1 Tax=Chitinophaga pinensis (strain ATCC 43595 / DSM 2588 / LMG 13176 / NBRC 15968 / NCIMB 11800 / UQM 2034) TaxID=485918 RepID=A0A979GQ01_CHIPD|nr:hypothetical protein [Chitinophaga pinensis]ACU59568.1 YD repeat protein [Chitinophaga pinensis DSM 2588]